MKKLLNKSNVLLTRAKFAAEDFLNEERGDTNFISIAIILVIVIVIAVVFAGLGDTMKAALESSISDLKGALHIN